MNKVLICYFSATGTAKEIALKMADVYSADLFEIEPIKRYTKEDLDWTNKQSRTSIEMNDKSSRPEIVKKVENIDNYDTIVIGFPVWWYTAPTIINTFIEENDLTNKQIYVFVTSGSSSESGSFNDLKELYPNLNFKGAQRFTGNEEDDIYKVFLVK